MITLIVGGKGTGKTKRLIEKAQQALEISKGNVIAIEKGKQLRYGLTHRVRLIDSDEFMVDGYFSLYGFLAGLCAGNYDITDIFVDGTFKICGDDFEGLEVFIKKVNKLIQNSETNMAITISADESELPEGIKDISKIA